MTMPNFTSEEHSPNQSQTFATGEVLDKALGIKLSLTEFFTWQKIIMLTRTSSPKRTASPDNIKGIHNEQSSTTGQRSKT